MKVENTPAGVTPPQQISQPAPVASPATVVPAADTQTPKEDLSDRTNARIGRTNSFASKPSVPAITHVAIGQPYAYSPIRAGGNPAVAVGAAGAAPAPSRKDLLDAMTKDLNPAQRAKVDQAATAYSDQQLKQMKDMGVRFKEGDGMPPERADNQPDGIGERNEGMYRPDKRTIQIKPSSTPDHIRHEFAHAWDDAKNEGANPLRTKDTDPQYLKDGKTEALKQKYAADKAVSLRAQARAYGEPKATELNAEAERLEKKAGFWKPGYASSDPKMVDAYEKYIKRTDGNGTSSSDKVFDSTASRGHSQKNVQEFYAEGYTVFHGNDPSSERARMRMRQHAPELYEMLKKEAIEQKLPTPLEPPFPKYGDPLKED